MEAASASSVATTLFLDDSTRNIAAAAELGLFTVLVGRLGANMGAHMEVLLFPQAAPPPQHSSGAVPMCSPSRTAQIALSRLAFSRPRQGWLDQQTKAAVTSKEMRLVRPETCDTR